MTWFFSSSSSKLWIFIFLCKKIIYASMNLRNSFVRIVMTKWVSFFLLFFSPGFLFLFFLQYKLHTAKKSCCLDSCLNRVGVLEWNLLLSRWSGRRKRRRRINVCYVHWEERSSRNGGDSVRCSLSRFLFLPGFIDG